MDVQTYKNCYGTGPSGACASAIFAVVCYSPTLKHPDGGAPLCTTQWYIIGVNFTRVRCLETAKGLAWGIYDQFGSIDTGTPQGGRGLVLFTALLDNAYRHNPIRIT